MRFPILEVAARARDEPEVVLRVLPVRGSARRSSDDLDLKRQRVRRGNESQLWPWGGRRAPARSIVWARLVERPPLFGRTDCRVLSELGAIGFLSLRDLGEHLARFRRTRGALVRVRVGLDRSRRCCGAAACDEQQREQLGESCVLRVDRRLPCDPCWRHRGAVGRSIGDIRGSGCSRRSARPARATERGVPARRPGAPHSHHSEGGFSWQ